jgi:hypothetical protein
MPGGYVVREANGQALACDAIAEWNSRALFAVLS